VIWSRVLSELAKLAALLVVVPLVLIIALGLAAAILPIIIYLQLILIWVQAEISLRQTALFAAQFEPAFDVKIADAAWTALTIENVSENPAYNVVVSRLLDEIGTPIDPKQWQDKLELDGMASLAPHEKRSLCVWKDQSLRDRLMTHGGSLEISYFGRQGELQTLSILFSAGQLLIVSGGALPPGVLLRTFEAVSSTWRILRFRRSLRKKRGRTGN
jgi:hypothetical protein